MESAPDVVPKNHTVQKDSRGVLGTSFPASFPVVLGDFGCDVTCQACRENSPRTPLVTRIARTGLGTKLRVSDSGQQRWLLSAHARTIPRFLGFSYFSQNKQIWAAKIDHPNFEGGLSFNRSSVSQLKDINIKTNSTWRQTSMFHVLYGIFSVDKALLVVDT